MIEKELREKVRALLLANVFGAHAERLRGSLHSLIEKSGFREYYDPIDGSGRGAREFTWSGLIVDNGGRGSAATVW